MYEILWIFEEDEMVDLFLISFSSVQFLKNWVSQADVKWRDLPILETNWSLDITKFMKDSCSKVGNWNGIFLAEPESQAESLRQMREKVRYLAKIRIVEILLVSI